VLYCFHVYFSLHLSTKLSQGGTRRLSTKLSLDELKLTELFSG
jgi:hypothetical protein